jgi:cell division protein ZapA
MSAVVSITIAGRSYEMACDAGQQQTLIDLSGEIDRRAQDLLKSVGPVSDTRLLVMVALTLVDDLTEARKRPPPASPDELETDSKIAAGLDRLANRIEAIADRLQKA